MVDSNLLERDTVLDEMSRLLLDATVTGGRLVFLGGEAGSGKTSVVRELARRAGRRALVLAGGCDPLGTPRPLSPLLDIATDPESGLSDLVGEDAEPYDLFAVLLRRLKGTIRPTLLVVEDVHWADEATLDLLRYLGRRIDDSNALVVVTYRDDELRPDHPLRRVLGDLASNRRSVLRLAIEPLSLDAVTTLAAGSGVAAEQLHRVTGGNAFFVSEILAAGDDLPVSIQDAVLARVTRLGTAARQVVEAVSIAPRSLEARYLGPLVGSSTVDTEAALTSGVVLTSSIMGDATGLHFRHELARAAVELSISPPRRVDLHRRMVELLIAEGSDDFARIAHHAVRTGDATLILEHSPTAARLAMRRGAVHEAVAFFSAAAGCADALADGDRGALLHDLSRALVVVDRQHEALDAARAAVAAHRRAGETTQLALALTDVGRGMWMVGDTMGARQAIAEAVDLLDTGGDSEPLAYALHRAGHLEMLARHHQPAIANATRSWAIARRLGATEAEAMASVTLGTAEMVTGDSDVGITILEEVLAGDEGGDDTRTGPLALGMLGTAGGEIRRYRQAKEWLERCIEVGRRKDEDYIIAYATAWLARIAFEQGLWDEAVALAEKVIAADRQTARISPITAFGVLGRVRVRRGDPGAEEALRASLEVAAHAELQHRWPALCGLAELYWLRNRSDEAVEILTGPYEEALATDSPWAQGEIGFWLWRNGGIDASPTGWPPPLAAVPFAQHMAGNLEAAADTWRSIGCPYEEALALADGDGDGMLRALDVLIDLGARPVERMVRSRLREAGITAVPRGPHPSTRRHPAGLTPRQSEVLDHLEHGLSNRQIADRLFISRKTVEHHVSAILAKLGVATRDEAVARTEAKNGGGSRRSEGGSPTTPTDR